MSFESGKRQLMKLILMIIAIFGIIGFMMISFLFIPYGDITTYVLFNIAIDGIGILLLIFLVNMRVWRYISGRQFYSLEIHKPEGTVDSELWIREGYFEVDIDKIEEDMNPEQIKILRENERAIALLKRSVAGMNDIAKEKKESRKKDREKQRLRDRIRRKDPSEEDEANVTDEEVIEASEPEISEESETTEEISDDGE
jgi:hypothetical protein